MTPNNNILKNELSQLTLDIYRTNFVGAIEKIENFYQKYKARDKKGWLKRECNRLLAEALEDQQAFDQALAINLEILAEMPTNEGAYGTMVHRTASLFNQLERRKEANALIEEFLNQKQDHFSETLYLMALYVQNYGEYEKLPGTFPPLFQWIVENLQIEVADTNLQTAIVQVANESREAGRSLTRLLATCNQLPEEEEIDLVKQYIATVKIGFYRKHANSYLQSILKYPR